MLHITGILITFIFLSLITALRPYCTVGLSNLQSCALMAQFITLFGGILLIIDKYISEEAQNAGETTSQVQQKLVAYAIYAANLSVMMWPVLQMAILGQFSETMEKLKKLLLVFKRKKFAPLQRTEKDFVSTPISLADSLSKVQISSPEEPETEGLNDINQTQTFLAQGVFQNSEYPSVYSSSNCEIHADIYIDI